MCCSRRRTWASEEGLALALALALTLTLTLTLTSRASASSAGLQCAEESSPRRAPSSLEEAGLRLREGSSAGSAWLSCSSKASRSLLGLGLGLRVGLGFRLGLGLGLGLITPRWRAGPG